MSGPVLDRRMAMAVATVGGLLARLSAGAAGAPLPKQDFTQGGNPVSDTDRNKQMIHDFIEVVWRQGHLDRLGEFWTEDCVNHAAPAGQDRGLAALRAYHEGFGTAFAAFSDMQINLQQQVAEADRVVTQILATVRHTGTFLGIAPTGRTVSLATIRIDRMQGGKIAEHWSVADMAGLMQQLKA